ncbi:hypothetical protein CAPN004_03300 [Capnocytophaga cynodegmi]|uniref:hypothetical protein n=1 Tax=Capnocytophaga cynodegmi TaxID=28189 RepID=UPI001AC9FA75|nr:hypothetical protein [Capnocytophaga cynodegmi]GIM51300.1 hypothetical protein CAPN004_03300 [Capnocytophaga cynodegmi]
MYTLIRSLKMSLLSVVLLIACKKESDTDTKSALSEDLHMITNVDLSKMYDKDYISNADIEEQLTYKKYHLFKVVNWLSKNNTIIKKAADLTGKQSNGVSIYEPVKVKDLFSNNSITGKSLEMPFSENDILKSLDAFKGIDPNKDWEVTVHTVSEDDDINISNPLYIINDESFQETDSKGNVLMKGFKYKNGTLMLHNELISEEYANKNLVYVVGLESSDENRNIEQSNLSSRFVPNNMEPIATIDRMVVRDGKETWVGGKSEIAVIAFTDHYYSDAAAGYCGIKLFNGGDCVDPGGKLIRKFSRKEVRRRSNVAVNHTFYHTDRTKIKGDALSFIIFEEDVFPRRGKIELLRLGRSVRSFRYRSLNNPYYCGVVALVKDKYNIPYFSGFVVDNGSIRFNFR